MILSFGMAAVAAGMSLSCQDHTLTMGPRPVADFIAARVAVEDGYVVGATPNLNTGSSQILRIEAGDHRILVRFDQAELAAVVGGDSLAGAILQLTITGTPVSWDAQGRYLFLHRVTQGWAEAGATWNCAIDAVPGNGVADCAAPNNWVMGTPVSSWPFAATPTVGKLITNGLSGTIQLDVTADVRAFLAGTPNRGWILKKADENVEGQVSFGSRESATPPQLLLGIVQGDTTAPPIPSSFTPPNDSSRIIAAPSDTSFVFYRDILGISFKPGTSGATIRSVFQQYGATIIGGAPLPPAAYYVRVSDPGPSDSLVRALVAAVRAEPSVSLAWLVAWRSPGPVPHGRYPNDGAQARRSDWFGSGSTITRAFVEARAPLAWGCETGVYDPLSAVNVGTIDFVFDTAQADFRVRLTSVIEPGGSEVTQHAQELTTNPAWWHHGTAVLGVLAAAGANDSGVAGMYWGGRAFGFALVRSPLQRVKYPLGYMSRIIERAIAENVRVLNASLDFPTPQEHEYFDSYVSDVQTSIQRYLAASPRNLFVLSAGNDRIRASVADWASGSVLKKLALMGAVARLDATAFKNQIIVVAGTDNPSAFWEGSASSTPPSGSNHMTGVSRLAARATQRALLSHAQGPGGQALHVDSGTSYAAPMVAGAAALLMTFDPALTSAEAKGYLLGSQVVLSDGALGGRPQIPAPGGSFVYQLDVYSALQQLATDRAGLPVCGYPVRLFDDFISVRLDAPGPAARTLTVPGATGIQTLSVAQGGRRIAAYDWALDRTVVMNHLGQVIHQTATGVKRSYLEVDTVDAVFNAGLNRDIYTIRGDSTFPNIDFFAPVLTPTRTPNGLAISPDGERALVHLVEGTNNNPCGHLHLGFTHSYFVTRGGSESLIRTQEHCGPFSSVTTAWSHAATKAMYAVSAEISGIEQSVVTSAAVGQGSPIVTFDVNRRFTGLAYSPDDSLVLAYRFDRATDNCFSRWVNAASHALLGTDQPAPLESCFLRREIPNAPPGYSLYAQGQAPGRQLLRSRAVANHGWRTGPIVVRVN